MPQRKIVTSVAYRDFLLYASLFILLGTLAASVYRCALIFPPYMQAADIISDDKTAALDFLALPAASAGICAFLSSGRGRLITGKSGAALAACGLAVPCGAILLRLGDAYFACNYVPPAIIFAALTAAAIAARGFIKRMQVKNPVRRRVITILCSLPLSVIAVVAAVAGYSGHKLFATLVFLYLPIPFCAAAALASSAIKSARTAAAVMCVPLSVCVFCALRPYGFDLAFELCAALAAILPLIAFVLALNDFKITKKTNTGVKHMSNKIVSGLGFHHIALKAADFEKSYVFYTEGLGMTPVATWGEGDCRIQMLDIGDGTILELFAGGGNDADAGRYIHLALKCDDVDAAFARAIAAGARVKSEPRTVPLDSKPSPMTLRCGFVYGLSGEELEFFKVLEK
jgi:4-hydroxyphenylpyruvate dioxygenase and related hemolysins